MINDQKEKQVEMRTEDTEQQQKKDQGGFNERTNPPATPSQATDQELESKWKKVKKPLQIKYPELTDDDLHYNKGEFGKMLGRVGTKTGMTETQLRKKILDWDDASGTF